MFAIKSPAATDKAPWYIDDMEGFREQFIRENLQRSAQV